MRYLRLKIILAVLFFGVSVSGQQQTFDKIKAMSDSISIGRIRAHIANLERAGGHYSRVTLTPGNDSARIYIKKSFDSIPGLSVTQDTFYHTTAPAPYNTKPMMNIIATIPGINPSGPQYIIGAHYDCSASRMGSSVWNQQWATIRTPGADDNATGIAGILEIARILSDTSFGFRPDFTIKLIAFAAEESSPAYSGSHLGSKDYATRAFNRGDVINGMISLDMIGYNNNFNYTSVVSDASSQFLGEKMIDANGLFGIGLITNEPPFPYAVYSDHDQFWAKGYKAILVIENAPPWNNSTYYVANPLYHTSYDSLGSVNLELVKKVTQLNFVTVSSLASRLTDVAEREAEENRHGLHQNFPNPFNARTTIKFNIPEAMRGSDRKSGANSVTLKVYDILGRELATLIEEELSAGTHSAVFDASALASGIYYYRLRFGSFSETRKMLVIR